MNHDSGKFASFWNFTQKWPSSAAQNIIISKQQFPVFCVLPFSSSSSTSILFYSVFRHFFSSLSFQTFLQQFPPNTRTTQYTHRGTYLPTYSQCFRAFSPLRTGKNLLGKSTRHNWGSEKKESCSKLSWRNKTWYFSLENSSNLQGSVEIIRVLYVCR